MEIIFILFAVGLLLWGAVASSGGIGAPGEVGSAPASPVNENLPDPGITTGPLMTITNDPATWPGGDVIWNICRAIAHAEGADIVGSVPDRLNNPGDISDGGNLYPQEQHSGSSVTIFPTKEVGWSWLREKISNAASGVSRVYLPNMTWTQIAQKWAGNWPAWLKNVSGYLGVDPNSTLQQYTGQGGI